MWFSRVTEQSPFLLRTRASGLCFRGFHPCLTCSYPPKWQPAAHGNKQKLTNLSVQVHRLLEFEVVSCFPKNCQEFMYIYIYMIYITYPPFFEDLDTRVSSWSCPKGPLGVPLRRHAGCGWCGDVSGCDMNQGT